MPREEWPLPRSSDFADLKSAIRDLNGDGKDELILWKSMVEYDCAHVAAWPAVYRFENGKYVEASRDFPAFYDHEMLPQLDDQISKAQAKVAAGQASRDRVAEAKIEKDKILRMLGRDPTAGLQQAYQWLNTDDPDLLQDAEFTFNDIGDHQEEARAAVAGYTRARCERDPGLAMCGNAVQR